MCEIDFSRFWCQ